MKKFLKIGIALLTVVLVCTYAYAEIKCKVELKSDKKEVAKETEFVVKVDLADVEAEKGIITLGATLEYDDANLELVKLEGKNGWANPSYNEENGKFVMDRNEPTTEGETAIEITFKSKDTAKKDIEVILKEVSVANGDDKSDLEDASTKITIKGDSKKENTTEENKTSENTTKENTTPISKTNTNITRNTNTNVAKNTTNTATVASTDIPKAGDTNIVTMVFAIATAALCVLYFGKLNEIKKKEHDMNIEK